MHASQLKAKLEPMLHLEPESFRIRVHRAISWLTCWRETEIFPGGGAFGTFSMRARRRALAA